MFPNIAFLDVLIPVVIGLAIGGLGMALYVAVQFAKGFSR